MVTTTAAMTRNTENTMICAALEWNPRKKSICLDSRQRHCSAFGWLALKLDLEPFRRENQPRTTQVVKCDWHARNLLLCICHKARTGAVTWCVRYWTRLTVFVTQPRLAGFKPAGRW
jgi:hypothetical protein